MQKALVEARNCFIGLCPTRPSQCGAPTDLPAEARRSDPHNEGHSPSRQHGVLFWALELVCVEASPTEPRDDLVRIGRADVVAIDRAVPVVVQPRGRALAAARDAVRHARALVVAVGRAVDVEVRVRDAAAAVAGVRLPGVVRADVEASGGRAGFGEQLCEVGRSGCSPRPFWH
eukprot:2739149-Alexandrium_andersonii.AAC.1